MNKKLKVYLVMGTLLFGLLSGTIIVTNSLKKENNIPVNTIVNEEVTPVVLKKDIIEKPYKDENVYVISHYYDYKDTEERQINSIIIYDNTYTQNTGIIYGNDNSFDIFAVASGEVINVSDSELTGKIVEIRHTNDIISTYKFLSDVNVKINDKVSAGEKIGTSGINNITDKAKNQLYFEFIIRGELVNGENFYGKNIEEL